MSSNLFLGGYPLDLFVEKPDEDLICGICFDVLKSPRQCSEGHTFCHSCISEALKNHHNCPSCKVAMTALTLSVSLITRNMINKLSVKCSIESCVWIGPLGELEHHLTVCEHQLIDCKLYKHKCCTSFCNGKVSRRAENEHLTNIYTEQSGKVFPKMLSLIENLSEELSIMRSVATIGYVGGRKNNLKDGIGFEKTDKNEFYTGTFRLGKIDGRGILTKTNLKYVGNFHNGNPHGTGTVELSDGEVYTGDWLDGKRHGRGKCMHANGDVYEGQWQNGLRHGHGMYKLSNGSGYEGEWLDGKRNGQGVFKYASGSVYEGQWKDGKMHGQGVYRWPDGQTYEGGWNENKQNGRGVTKYANDDIGQRDSYEGEWTDGGRHGHAVLQWTSGRVYEGQWLNNRRHGVGKTTHHGTVFEGKRVENARHGSGKLTHTNGTVFEGEWTNGPSHDSGKVTYPSGNAYGGALKTARLVRHSQGKLTHADCTVGNVTYKQMLTNTKNPFSISTQCFNSIQACEQMVSWFRWLARGFVMGSRDAAQRPLPMLVYIRTPLTVPVLRLASWWDHLTRLILPLLVPQVRPRELLQLPPGLERTSAAASSAGSFGLLLR